MLRRIRGHHIWPAPLNSDSIVVDAGAHRGEFSRALIDEFGCRCFLIEANPELARELRVPKADAVLSAALAASDGKASFHSRDNPESGSIIADASTNGSVTVETISLPTLMKRFRLQSIDLLKLDIEGAEFELIAQTPDSVLRSISQITIEFHDFQPQFAGQQLFEQARARLKHLGFISCLMSFRTHGDVLFLNRERLRLGAVRTLYAQRLARFREKAQALCSHAG
jgi:FkbM family methyltransferase